jgi:hypothetical protein
MPIRKFDYIFGDDGLYTGKHETVVECDKCGKQIAFETEYSFGAFHQPPEVEELGFTKILKPNGHDFICREACVKQSL